jgi:hypothetical protein
MSAKSVFFYVQFDIKIVKIGEHLPDRNALDGVDSADQHWEIVQLQEHRS